LSVLRILVAWMYITSTVLSITAQAQEGGADYNSNQLPVVQHLSPSHGAQQTQISTVGIDPNTGEARSLGFNQSHYIDPNTGARVPNYYKLMGYNFAPNTGYAPFARFLEAGRVPLLFSEPLSTINTNPEYNRLLGTEAGRQNLIRQIEGLRYYLQFSEVVGVDHLKRLTLERMATASTTTTSNSTAVASPTDVERFRQISKIRNGIEVLKEYLDVSRHSGAKTLFRDGLREFRTLDSRNRYNLRYGLASAIVPDKLPLRARVNPINIFKVATGRAAMVEFADPNGSGEKILTRVDIPRAEQIRQQNIFKELVATKDGRMNLTRYGGGVLAAIYLFYIVDLTVSYRNNPTGFLDLKRDTLSMALPMAGISYLIGGATASHAASGATQRMLMMARQSLANIDMARKIFHNNPGLANQTTRAAMTGLTRTATFLQRAFTPMGIIAGIPIAKMAYMAMDTFASCIKLRNEDNSYDQLELQRLESACDRGWADFAGVLTDTETWLTVVSLLTASALVSFFMNATNLAKYATFKNAAQRARVLAQWSSVPVMAKNIVLTLRAMAIPALVYIVQFAAFSAVFYLSFAIFKHIVHEMMDSYPVKVTAEQYRRFMREYHINPNQLEYMCDNEGLMDVGDFWANLFHYFGAEFEQDVNCGLNLFNTYVEHYNKVNSDWRAEKIKPFDTAVMNWSSFLHKALSTHHSGYLFYKDVVEQVRVARKNNMELDFSYKNVSLSGQGPEIRLPYTVDQAIQYNNPLPLFRSDPTFGWAYRLQNSESPTVSYPDHRSFSVDWDADYANERNVEKLTKRFESFKTEVVPVLIEALEGYEETEMHQVKKDALSSNINLFRLGQPNHIAWALNNLYVMYKREVSRAVGCRFTPSNVIGSESVCFVSQAFIKAGLYDENLFSKSDDGRSYNFTRLDFRPGLDMSENLIAPKPQPMGNKFFMDYHQKFEAHGIETNYYEGKDYTSKGITDYLVKQMVCGVDTLSGDSLVTGGWMGAMGLMPQEFKLPRLPFKNSDEFNPCEGSSVRINARHRSLWPKGWPGGHNGHGIYSYIEDKDDISKNYVGVVHYLYEELSDDVVNNFDDWWERTVRHEFENTIEKLYQEEFIDKVVNGRDGILARNSFVNLVEGTEDLNDNCVEVCDDFPAYDNETIAQSAKQQLDTIFNYHLEPMFNNDNFSVRTRHYSDDDNFTITDEAAKEILFEQFRKVKTQMYELLFFTLGKKESLEDPELVELYNTMEAEFLAQGRVINSATTGDLDIIRLLVLNSLIRHVQYQMAILFQTDTNGLILGLVSSSLAVVETGKWTRADGENTIDLLGPTVYIPETEELVKDALLDANEDILAAHNSVENREGRMILQYNDFPYRPEGTPITEEFRPPSYNTVLMTQGKIDALFHELFDIYFTKLSVRGIN